MRAQGRAASEAGLNQTAATKAAPKTTPQTNAAAACTGQVRVALFRRRGQFHVAGHRDETDREDRHQPYRRGQRPHRDLANARRAEGPASTTASNKIELGYPSRFSPFKARSRQGTETYAAGLANASTSSMKLRTPSR